MVVVGLVVIGLDNPLHERMADDVAPRQTHPAAAGDMLETPHGVDEPAGAVGGEIDLRGVP